mmetsp:Transcript_18555/g.53662  ORF Transcript_18555/g.53662 Transcript_18555/m.53662 type:complete len:104 (+) Transcript_18555:2200-2511(+)
MVLWIHSIPELVEHVYASFVVGHPDQKLCGLSWCQNTPNIVELVLEIFSTLRQSDPQLFEDPKTRFETFIHFLCNKPRILQSCGLFRGNAQNFNQMPKQRFCI